MANNFLDLSKKQQLEIVEATSAKLALPTSIIEKDFWVCWVLEKLFELPLMMAFKGGTSLSKCYDLIHRFSEDLDITIDYHNFFPSIDLKSQSKTSLKKISETLKNQVVEQVKEDIFPYLQKSLHSQNLNRHAKLEINQDGDQILFYYPSLMETFNDYLREHVLIEFGGRNSTSPNELRQITPFISRVTTNLKLPSPDVKVLSPLRTFWEKTILIHVECHRRRLQANAERLSRHWYDLAMMISKGLDVQAMADKTLFNDVIQHKLAFYNASYANYDKCINNNFKLLPEDDELDDLRKDYMLMIKSGMFSKEPMRFEEVVSHVSALQDRLNSI
jgi:hypothetical protein